MNNHLFFFPSKPCVELFLRLLAGSRILSLRGEIEYASRLCESPIEEVMLLALALAGEAESDSGVEMQVREPSPFDHICHVLVNPQYVVGKYRVDFRVAAYWTRFDDENLVDEHWCRGEVLVECDGHDFHERTKEQASHDKRKDRDLQAAGFKVFRYTGSDVWNRCMEAATQVVSTAFAAAKESRPLVVRKRRSFKP